jgi:predicted transposase YbfD/YdcC
LLSGAVCHPISDNLLFSLKELNNPEHDCYAISDKSHGREEIRLHIVCDVPDELIEFTFEWKGLKKYAWQSPFGQ